MAWSTPRTWVTSEVVTAAHMNQEVRDNLNAMFPDEETSDDYSPTLEATDSNPTTSSATGQSYRIGAVRVEWGRFVLSSTFGGRLFVTIPESTTGISAQATEGSGSAIGSWSAYDTSTGVVAAGTVNLRAADEIQFSLGGVANASALSDFVPWTWASGDVLTYWIWVPVA